MTAGTGRPRLLSGRRPTGPLHLGHLLGAVESWVRLQDDYECFVFSADWHALTTAYEAPGPMGDLELENMAGFIAAGLDPERTTLFVQSHVKEHAELWLLFAMFTPNGWLERVPSYKGQQQELAGKDLSTYGFLGYPLLQAADILAYRAQAVPVGEDQVAHVELTREVARRFNFLYGRDLFPEPQAVLTPTPRVPGVDGRKMSASYGNALGIGDPVEATRAAVRTMVTDPARVRRSDPGTPEKCPVFDLHRALSSPDEQEWAARGCRSAGIGCLDCKAVLNANLDRKLDPIRERRAELLRRPDDLRDVLVAGAARAADVARPTVEAVREAMALGPTRFGRAAP
jgi:tryptophanyl-tRNA synthetase